MKLTIDGKKVEAEGKKSILDVARETILPFQPCAIIRYWGPLAVAGCVLSKFRGEGDLLPLAAHMSKTAWK